MALLLPRFFSHGACTPTAVPILGGSSRHSLETFLQATVWGARDDLLSYGGTQEEPCLGALLGRGMSPCSSPYKKCHGYGRWMLAFEDR